MIRSIKLGLASLALVAASLFAAPAFAADYTGNCANAPLSTTGNVIITPTSNPGACTIPRQVNASGYISITINGPISTKGFNAEGGSLTISASSGNSVTVDGEATSTGSGAVSISGDSVAFTTGTISTTNNSITVTANNGTAQTDAITNSAGTITIASPAGAIDVEGAITDTTGWISINAMSTVKVTGAIHTTGGGSLGGQVLIIAGSTLETQGITSSLGGVVDLNAQTQGGSAVFTIGGSGNTNGVNGTITTTGESVAGDGYTVWIYVTNGPSNSTNGITLTNSTDISVAPGAGARNGTIVLNAQNGPLNMPAGTMSVAGTGAIGGGQIILMGQTVTFAGTATLNTSQTTTTGFDHEVLIDATTLNYSGNLTLESNGPGYSAAALGGPGLQFMGATAVSVMGDPGSFSLNVGPSGNAYSALTVAGGGTLTMTGNGDNDTASIVAYPIAITGGAVTLQSQGKTTTEHGVFISNGPTLSGIVGLTFGGSGTVTLDASATSGSGNNGGYVTLNIDKGDFNAPTFVINANGPASGTGNGGTVSITSNVVTLNEDSTATVTANGATASTGTGGTINIQPQTGTTSVPQLGASAGYFTLAATSGQTGGTGGSVLVNNPNGSITIGGEGAGAAINVGAAATTGNAGSIALTSSSLDFGAPVSLTANGGSTTGNAGSITFNTTTNITLTGGNQTVSAEALGNGNGGTVTLNSNTADADLEGESINVSVQGKGNGGAINITSASMTLGSDLEADGGNKGGNGGNITLTGAINPSSTAGMFVAVVSAAVSANAGTITINGTSTQPITVGASGINIDASCVVASTGNAGTVTITNVGPVSVDGDYLSVAPCYAADGGNGGAGGKIAVTGSQVTVTNTLSADAIGNNLAGTISLTQTDDTTMTLEGATIEANADPAADGNGNTITLNGGPGTIALDTTTIETSGAATGSGGTINITADEVTLGTEATTILAYGGTDNGIGGVISIIVTPGGATALVIDPDSLSIAATGFGTGAGGTVVLNNVAVPGPNPPQQQTFLDVDQVIEVSAGSTAGQSVFDGSISINAVTCNQSKYSGDPWPAAYWDCTGGNAAVIPLVPQTAAALELPAYVLTPLSTYNARLYALMSTQDFNSFFARNPAQTANEVGETLPDFSGTDYVASAVFVNSTEGIANAAVAATTAHESGHAVDFVWGGGTSAVSLNLCDGPPVCFNSAYANDTALNSSFNTMNCTTVFLETPSVNCDNYPGMSNSDIFFQVFFGPVTPEGQSPQPIPQEMFAYVFEHYQTGSDPGPDVPALGGFEYILGLFTNMKAYMTTGINTGVHP